MSHHDNRVCLLDMLDYARQAQELVAGKQREAFQHDRVLQLALERVIEVIGEAANRISPEMRKRHSQIPWRNIVSMRNRLIHGYDVVDYDVIWSTATEDIPPLIKQLEAALGQA